MSLLAIVYHLVPEAPVLVAYNREESLDRTFPTPSIQSGKPRVLASVDPQTGGTYLGVNQNGMFVGVVKRRKPGFLFGSKSRGALAKEMLKCNSAQSALELALEELDSGNYGGANFCVADQDGGWVIHAAGDVNAVELEQGLCIVSNRDFNDPRDERAKMAKRLLTLQTLDSPVKFLAVASKVLGRTPTAPGRPGMVVREKDYGTISASLISLGKKPREAIYQHSNGSPDQTKFEDYSPLLRDILSRGMREQRAKAAQAN